MNPHGLRRFLATTAHALELSDDQRAAIGNWADTNDVTGKGNKQAEPMHIRYSAVRLMKSADTRRVCLAALAHVCKNVRRPTFERMPEMKNYITTFESRCALKPWGKVTTLAEPIPAPEMEQREAGSTDDSSSAHSFGSSSENDITDSDDDDTFANRVNWLMPVRSKGRAHVVDNGATAVSGVVTTLCSWRPDNSVSQGVGMASSAVAGVRWCHKCLTRVEGARRHLFRDY